jgi:uncharacterized SAM-dependent methyltransferase
MPPANQRFELLSQSAPPESTLDARASSRARSSAASRGGQRACRAASSTTRAAAPCSRRSAPNPEYYLTRAERRSSRRTPRRSPRAIAGPLELVELGSGSAEEDELLLRALSERGSELRYVPVDICRGRARRERGATPRALRRAQHPRHRGPSTVRVCACSPTAHAGTSSFSGSDRTWATSTGTRRASSWRHCDRELSAGDRLLLGVDLRKEKRVLEAAYDDAAG